MSVIWIWLKRLGKHVFGGPEQFRQPASTTEVAAVDLVIVSPEVRRALLNSAVMTEVQKGFSIVAQTDYDAVLERKPRTNNVMHAILSLITFGLWLLVWLLISIFSETERKRVNVDEFGRLTSS